MARTVVAIAACMTLLTAAPTQACIIATEMRLEDIREADAIAVGTVTEFDPAFVRRRSQENADKHFEMVNARTTFRIREVISGSLPPIVTVDWPVDTNNSSPKRMVGNYLFAVFNKSDSEKDPTTTHILMHQWCSGSFVFRRGSDSANAVREMFGLWPQPLEPEPKTLSDLFKTPPIPWHLLVFLGISALICVQLVAWLFRGKQTSRRD